MGALVDLVEGTRQRLGQYLAGEITLRTFEDWFVPLTWQPEAGTDDPAVANLVSEIELCLAEYSSGHWTEAELREHLRPLLDRTAMITRPTLLAPAAIAFQIAAFGVLRVRAIVIDNEAALVGKDEEPSLTLVGGTTAITPAPQNPIWS